MPDIDTNISKAIYDIYMAARLEWRDEWLAWIWPAEVKQAPEWLSTCCGGIPLKRAYGGISLASSDTS